METTQFNLFTIWKFVNVSDLSRWRHGAPHGRLRICFFALRAKKQILSCWRSLPNVGRCAPRFAKPNLPLPYLCKGSICYYDHAGSTKLVGLRPSRSPIYGVCRVLRLQFSTGRNEKAGIRPVYPHESTPCHGESRFLEQSYVKAVRNPGSKTIVNVDGHRTLENLVMYTPRNAPAAR